MFFLLATISSFDLVLNIKLGGFNIRLFYLIAIVISCVYLLRVIIHYNQIKFRFLGGIWFGIWFLFLLIFLYHTNLPIRNITYMIWLSISAFMVVSLSDFFSKANYLKIIVNLYTLSFTLLAILGISQFFLGLLGIDFYVEQWWIGSNVPRVNAFSYEPSYLATYLTIGWSFLFYLKVNKSNYLSNWFQNTSLILVLVCFILSSSRMGILLIVIQLVVWFALKIRKIVQEKKISKDELPLLFVGLGFVVMIPIIFLVIFYKFSFLLSGVGIGGEPSHSTDTRSKEFVETVDVFVESPLVGYSIGGIPSAIAENRGQIVQSQEECKQNEGMNVFAEMLAASGILGYIPFILFLLSLIFLPIKLSNQLIAFNIEDSHEYVVLLRAMVYAFVFECLILTMNQNILRAYFWLHIGVLNIVYYTIKQSLFVHIQKIRSRSKELSLVG